MKTKLPRDIQSLINKKAHRAGIAYAEQKKAELLVALERLQANGASLEKIRRYVEGSRG